ncbi:predicted protein [Chaetoceros tenuissimus]|uniref:Uncharacterized protein n=1 Tax=Chaetoceros tenuissimus TaxID=426638 RepID=A0AAD3CZA3_9STRA|nr:predicted protein [Chaetoceros tenuissimus]
MSTAKGNNDCTLYYFPVSNDDESYTLDDQCRNAYFRNFSLGTCTPSSVDNFDVLLRDVSFAEISPGQRDDSLHARKCSHTKSISECYPRLDFETKRNRYVSIDESVTKLKQTLEDDTLSGNNNSTKRQKLELTNTEQRYDTKRITRVSPPILEITFPKEEDHFHDASNHNQHYNQTMPLYPPSNQDREKPQQQEYLSGTLNFPYKDFIANNSKNESQLQLWYDEEEQSRLEKHFNPKWQVEFLSKFYSSGESLETPDIFGPKDSKKVSKNANVLPDDNHVFTDDTTNANFEQHFAQNEDEMALFMPISDPIENYFDMDNSSSFTCSTSTSDTSYYSLQEAAVKLCAAMDDTDKTRDIIARSEQHLNINRDELLKGK